MRVALVTVLLLLLPAACIRAKPDTPLPEPQTVATQPGVPQPAATPAAPATPQPEPAAAPAPSARTPTSPAAGTVAPPVVKTPAAGTAAAAPALDLDALTEELKATKAIGFFTKISLKNQVDDLLDRFREYYRGGATLTMKDLRRSYDLLMMKVLSLLQDADQELASAIVSSREAIWSLLADPQKFAALQG